MSEKKNWLVATVLKKLGLGAEAKIEKAYTRIHKEWVNDKRDLNHNLDSSRYLYHRNVEKLQDKLDLAKDELSEVWLGLDEDNTKGLELGAISTQFNQRLDKALLKVNELEEDLEDLKESFTSETEKTAEQIEAIDLRINYYEKGK